MPRGVAAVNISEANAVIQVLRHFGCVEGPTATDRVDDISPRVEFLAERASKALGVTVRPARPELVGIRPAIEALAELLDDYVTHFCEVDPKDCLTPAEWLDDPVECDQELVAVLLGGR